MNTDPTPVVTTAVQLPTPLAPFCFTVTSEQFDGCRDDVLNWGYNIEPGGGRKVRPDEPQFKFDLETRFLDNGKYLAEYNFDARAAGDVTNAYSRFLHWELDLGSWRAQWSYFASVVVFAPPADDKNGVMQCYVKGGTAQGAIPVQTVCNPAVPNGMAVNIAEWHGGNNGLRLGLGVRTGPNPKEQYGYLRCEDSLGPVDLVVNGTGGKVYIGDLTVTRLRIGRHVLTADAEGSLLLDGRDIERLL